MKLFSLRQPSLKRPALIILTLGSVIWSSASFALPEVSEEKGWSGYVGGGIAVTEITSNTVAGNRLMDLDHDPWNGNNEKADSRSEGYGLVTGEVTWTLGRRNALFLGTSMIDQLTQQGAQQFGWRKTTDSAGTFQVGAITSGALPTRVYNDPYNNSGANRGVTDQTTSGLRLGWDRIFSTAFEVTLTALDVEIDTENSGATQGLTAAEVRSLDREGDLVKLEVGYLFKLFGGDHLLRPAIIATDFDADGDAMDYDGAMAKITYSWIGGDAWSFVSNLSYGERDYDNANPVFGIEQDTDIVAIDASLIYDLPFGGERRWQLVTRALYADGDSDIDFHDQEAISGSVAVLYHFGNYAKAKERFKN